MKFKNSLNTMKQNWELYVLIAPFLVLFFLLTVLPVISSVVLSFFNFDMLSLPKFAGLENYIRMFTEDDIFLTVLKNTIVLAILTGPAGFILAFVLAWMINELGPFLRTVLSFMFYVPALTGGGLLIWTIAFSGDNYGYVNAVLLSLGITTSPIQWFSNATAIIPIVVAVQLWSSMGVSFLANISSLQNVNPELYEAGAVDGIRNRWQELWYITLPGMKSMLLFSSVMTIASAFSISSIITQLAGYPTVNYAADTIVSYLNDVGSVKYEMGYASALSVILFALMFGARKLFVSLLNKAGE